jgi:hypothetical protein
MPYSKAKLKISGDKASMHFYNIVKSRRFGILTLINTTAINTLVSLTYLFTVMYGTFLTHRKPC